MANPVVDNVASGSISIQQTGDHTEITQTSQKGIVNWQSFNISAQESTHFQQPQGGITLNRINPHQGVSEIYGKLSATGQIILINSAGIYFGPTARVDVAGIIATTANITDQNFLAGNYIFQQSSSYNGAVINQGVITAAEHGLIALAAPAVRNDGLVEANLGNVVLASGDAYTMSFTGNELVSFTIDKAITSAGIGPEGEIINEGVKNAGTITANGGQVLITAKAASKVLDNAINMTGIVEAKAVSVQNSTIILSGGEEGKVVVAGKLDASGKVAGKKGGSVTITGKNLYLTSVASIDTSGDLGGGIIRVGGNYQGKGPLPNAQFNTTDKGAVITADALTMGNGGEVIFWGDVATGFYGSISAKGGALGGDGGFVETSGHYLNVSGARVNTASVLGNAGTWLLDPTDVTITTSANSNESFASNTYTPSGDTANIQASDLITNLGSGNVTVSTTSAGAGNGDISVDTALTWTSTNTLTLNSTRNIYINADITATSGGLTLSADSNAQSLSGGTIGSGDIGDTVGTLTADISVNNFTLSQGQWFQVAATLPTFSVGDDFKITTGDEYNGAFEAQFTRLNTTTSPYGIADVYGLQGAATGPMSTDYNVSNAINAATSANWQSDTGFIPIGNSTSNYSGTFNGQNFIISNLTETPTVDTYGLGLFYTGKKIRSTKF